MKLFQLYTPGQAAFLPIEIKIERIDDSLSSFWQRELALRNSYPSISNEGIAFIMEQDKRGLFEFFNLKQEEYDNFKKQ